MAIFCPLSFEAHYRLPPHASTQPLFFLTALTREDGVAGAPYYFVQCTYTSTSPHSLALAYQKYSYVGTSSLAGGSKPLRWDFYNCLEGQCGEETGALL